MRHGAQADVTDTTSIWARRFPDRHLGAEVPIFENLRAQNAGSARSRVVIVERLELVDFRNYDRATFELTPGTTVVVGDNGQGKTNFAEALGYLATLESFRSAPPEAMVRAGADAAVVRAEVCDDDARRSLVEAELVPGGRNRVQVNRQRLGRARDLLGVVRVTVFSPDDLTLVKGGPAERRRFLDDTLVALALKYDAARLELERIMRQRNSLLRQAGGRLDALAASTLDVWDARLAQAGERFGHARSTLVARIEPHVTAAYQRLAGDTAAINMIYDPPWRPTGLAAALAAVRDTDVRRGTSTVGPHRDELSFSINGLPARTHASQGEQRTLALALRLGAHRLVADRTGSTPVLVLDDVLSELDPRRAEALLRHLPSGQVIITTAGAVPAAAAGERTLRITGGDVVAEQQGVPLDGGCAPSAPLAPAPSPPGSLAVARSASARSRESVTTSRHSRTEQSCTPSGETRLA